MYTKLVYINEDHPSLIGGSATYTLLFKLKPSQTHQFDVWHYYMNIVLPLFEYFALACLNCSNVLYCV